MSAASALLRSVIGRHKRIAFYALTAAGAAALCTLAVPGVMRAAVDGALHGDVRRPFMSAAALAVLTATASAARYAGGALLGEAVAGDLLAVVTGHVRTLDAATFDRHPANDLLSQLTADTLLLQDSSVPAVMVACRNALLLSGALLGALITAPKLLVLALLPPLALIPVLKLLGRRSRDALGRLKQTDATVYSRLRELLDDLPGLQALRLDAAVHADLMHALEQAQVQRRARIKARALSVFVGIAGVFGGVTLVLYIGTSAAVAGSISGGTLTAFVLYVAFAAGAAGSLSEVRGEIQKASAALARLSTVLQLQPQVRNPERTLSLPRGIDPTVPAIEFKDVSFVYNIQRPTPVLQNVSFSIMPGEHVVLTGPSGGGKSSVFALLLRLRLPTSGSIFIHGVPIEAIDLDELRNAMAYVPQTPRLRDGSAADAVAAPDEATLQRVLREADLSETIAALPQGAHTLLGESGGALSGGQRQRLTLARALARDSSILLCDEATSAVDAASQARILAALRARNQTILYIAHGTDAAAEATRVLSLENGMIV